VSSSAGHRRLAKHAACQGGPAAIEAARLVLDCGPRGAVLASRAVSDDSTRLAVILVAGIGARLGDVEGRPKCLVPVGERSLLLRALDALLAVGVEEIVFATGYREEAIREAVEGLPLRAHFCPNPAYSSTQNAVSLHHCADAVAGRSFFKLDGDVLFGVEVLERLRAGEGAIRAAVDRSVALADEEMKVLMEGDRITAFGKHLDPARAAGESIGIERIDASIAGRLFEALAEAVRQGRTGIYYEHVYDALLGEGVDVRSVDVTGLPWTEIDTPEDLAQAQLLLRRMRGAEPSP